MSFSKVMAIDGPSGSGKSTIAKLVSEELKMLYVDTGAMFRALGYVCQARGISFEEGTALDEFLSSIHFEYAVDATTLVQIDGENLTDKIRLHHVSELASLISKLPSVRTFLLNFQRDFAKEHFCAMEGRDIGTVVFPDAFCKIFLTASLEERARRRFEQLRKKGTLSSTMEEIIEDVRIRDERDSSRAVAPLKKADDAILVDSTGMEVPEVIQKISKIVRERAIQTGLEL